MRLRLILAAVYLALAASAAATADDQQEQDRNGGLLIFEISRILVTKPTLDAEARVALGASLEYLFLQLQRSKTKASQVALARTAVLQLDAGGAESRNAAMFAKGRQMIAELTKVQVAYQHLCTPRPVAVICGTQDDVTKYIEDMQLALRKPSAASK